MSTYRKKAEYWRLADAKNRFSEVAREASLRGPQTIYRRDGNVVVIAESAYLGLIGSQGVLDFKAFLLTATPDLSDLDLTRDHSSMRETDL